MSLLISEPTPNQTQIVPGNSHLASRFISPLFSIFRDALLIFGATETFRALNNEVTLIPFANRFLPSTSTAPYLCVAASVGLFFIKMLIKQIPATPSAASACRPENIKAVYINPKADEAHLYGSLAELFVDIPSVKHYESSYKRPPESFAKNLVQIKISNPADLLPFLPANLQKIINGYSPTHTGSASILVVEQAWYELGNEKLRHQWHDIYFQGPLARLRKGQSLVNYHKGSPGNYSWIRTSIGMFGRFGHATDGEAEAISQLSQEREYNHKAKDPTRVFMPFEKLDKTEQQIHHGMSGAHGSSIYFSGKNPLEGGFVFCVNSPKETDNAYDHGLPLWHLSLVMICNKELAARICDAGYNKAAFLAGYLAENFSNVDVEQAQAAADILARIDTEF